MTVKIVSKPGWDAPWITPAIYHVHVDGRHVAITYGYDDYAEAAAAAHPDATGTVVVTTTGDVPLWQRGGGA